MATSNIVIGKPTALPTKVVGKSAVSKANAKAIPDQYKVLDNSKVTAKRKPQVQVKRKKVDEDFDRNADTGASGGAAGVAAESGLSSILGTVAAGASGAVIGVVAAAGGDSPISAPSPAPGANNQPNAGAITEGTPTTTGTLIVADADSATIFKVTNGVSTHGTYTIAANGDWTYTLNNDSDAVQALNDDQTLTDTFTGETVDGTQQSVTITIAGANDLAVVTGDIAGEVIEAGDGGAGNQTPSAGTATATGKLISTEVDNFVLVGETLVLDGRFQPVIGTDASPNGMVTSDGRGWYTITAEGNWTFTLNNNNGVVQSANVGDTLSTSFDVFTIDGTKQTVSVSIKGANDKAVISVNGTPVTSVTEAGGVDNNVGGSPTASGDLNATDVDGSDENRDNPTTFVPQGTTQVPVNTTYGTFTIDANGTWNYTLASNNSTVNALDTGSTPLTDTITVSTIDGTTYQIKITINGTTDGKTLSVSDGYVSGAQIYIDVNNDGVADTSATTNEILTGVFTDANGNFLLPTNAPVGTVIALGGFNIDTGLPNGMPLKAPAGSTVITPLTTLVQEYIEVNVGASTTAANTAILAALGLPDNIDLTTYDAIAELASNPGNTSALDIQKAAVQVATIVSLAVEAGSTAASVIDNLVIEIANTPTTPVDLTNLATLDAILPATITPAMLLEIQTATTAIDAATSLTQVTAAQSQAHAAYVDIAENSTAVTYPAFITTGFGTPLTYSIVGGADEAQFNINPTTGALIFITAPDFEIPTDVGDDRTYDVTVQVSDGTKTDTQALAITVTNLNDNVAQIAINGIPDTSVTEAGGVGNATPNDPNASGDLNATDADENTTSNATLFQVQTGEAKTYGTFTINDAGEWSYVLGNTNAALQALNATSTPLTEAVEVFTAGGTKHTINIDINGANDAAVITGTSSGAVTEAGGVANAIANTPTTTGDLLATDPDNTTDVFQAVNAGATTANGYGTYGMTAAGVWTYTLSNDHATVQALNASSTPLTDSFTVRSADGTSQVVNITINGANDVATITGTSSGTVIEAGGVANATVNTPTATGDLLATDIDNTLDTFIQVNAGATTANGYGTYELTAAGVWTYTLSNDHAAVQALNTDSAPLSDSFTVFSADGTTQVVNITINGANDAASTGTGSNLNGAVTEAGTTPDATPSAGNFSVGLISDTNASPNSIAENLAAGTPVGITAFATDADTTNNTITYSLTGNTTLPGSPNYYPSNAFFDISNAPDSVGVVTLKNGVSLNYETAASHTIQVQAASSDGSQTTKVFTIAVVNANDAPTGGVTISDTTPTEDQALTASHTLIDEDGMNAISYVWQRANDAAFTDGVSTVGTATTFTPGDTEVGKFLRVTASYTDGLSNFTNVSSAVTAAVININDAPVAVADTLNTSENTPITFSSTFFNQHPLLGNDTDVDTASSAFRVFSVLAGTGGTVSLSGGIVTFTPTTNFNGPASFSYKVTDGTLISAPATVTVNVGAVNDAPIVANAIADQSASEDSAFNFTLPTNTFSDVDGDVLSYAATLASGAALPTWLTFDAATRSFSGTPLNANVGTITVRVTATDGSTASAFDDFTIAVTNTNDLPTGAPTISGITTEGQTLTASTSSIADEDGLGAFSYQWVRGNANISSANSSTYTLVAADVGQTISVKISYADARGTAESVTSTPTAAITAANSNPVIITDSNNALDTVAENASIGTVVGITTLGSDADTNATITGYVLTNNAGGRFAINTSGVVTVAGALDYGNAVSHTITVQASSSDGSQATKDFIIAVTDVNEAPTAVVLSNPVTSTPENGGVIKVADIVITDDALGTEVLTLSGADAASFSIFNNELRFNGGANFESNKTSYSVTVNANDETLGLAGSVEASQAFTLNITNVNEAPTAVVLSNPVTSTPENGGVIRVADIIITDDALGTEVLTLSGTDKDFFEIVDGASGKELRFIGGANFEGQKNYDVTVNANDETLGVTGSIEASQNFTLTITDVNEAPTAVVLSGQITSTPENGGVIKVADIVITDDSLGTEVLTLSGADVASFSIVGNELRFIGGANFESDKTSYSVTVNANDTTLGAVNSIEASTNFTLNISDINEAPTAVVLSNQITSTPENGGVIKVADIIITDDALGTEALTLSGADVTSFSIVGNELRFVGGANFESGKTSYSVTVNANDETLGAANSIEASSQTFTLNISDVNEAPTAVVLSNPVTSTPENGGNIKVADIAVTDDALGIEVLTLSGTDKDFFEIVGTELRFIGGANFEGQKIYNVTVNANDEGLGAAGSVEASQAFTLNISNINEAPTLAAVTAGSIVEIPLSLNTTDTGLSGTLQGSDVDVGDVKTYGILVEGIIVQQQNGFFGTLTVNNSGAYTYTKNTAAVEALGAGELAEDLFTVLVKDTAGLTATRTYSVSVTGANEAPSLSNSFKFIGASSYDLSGSAVSNAGDVNGDGFDDIIIGAPGAGSVNIINTQFDDASSAIGASYVVFGSATGFANLNLNTLTPAQGFKLTGVAVGDKAGSSVSNAGDVNGDGIGDMIVGASEVGNSVGASYVVFGKAAGSTFADINLADLNGTNGFKLSGVAINDLSGISVSSAGDVNGDGIGDLIVGARGVNLSTGAAYIVFGKTTGFAADINLGALGTGGFMLVGEEEQGFAGIAVSGAGDVNGDGFDDLIIGATRTDRPEVILPNGDRLTPSDVGDAYVVFGRATGLANTTINVRTLDAGTGTTGFKLIGVAEQDWTGTSVSSAGDINGDGFDDMIIGADQAAFAGGGPGLAYVIFGQAAPMTAGSINLALLNGTNGFKITGEEAFSQAGRSVSSAGDVNGDGFDDLIIGAPKVLKTTDFNVTPNATFYDGASYIVFGKATGFAANINLATLNGTDGFKLAGENIGDQSGTSVSSAGDVNGDGFDDLIVGAPLADPSGAFSGASYVILGGNFTGAVTHLGTATDNSLSGTIAAETFVGGLGNDTLAGGGGADAFQGGAGNDTIVISDLSFLRVDGGSGSDTLSLSGTGMTLNLASFDSKIVDIETINLTGSGNNSLTVSALTLLGLSDTSNLLTVKGNAGDSVSAAGFVAGANVVVDTITYASYTSGQASLLVQQGVNVTI